MTVRSPIGRDLRRLARTHGVQTSYQDMGKQRRSASPEALLLVLRALGVPVAREGDAAAALRHEEEERNRAGVAAVQLAWNGQLDALELRHSLNATPGRTKFILHLQHGGTVEWTATPQRLPLRRGVVEPRFDPGLRRALPFGYHRLELRTGRRAFESLVIATPKHAHLPALHRSWGNFMPLYALRSERDRGIGDYTDLEAFARWTAELGGGFVGTLPLLATFLSEPFEPSPYAPVSRLFWSDVFLDPDRLPGQPPSAQPTARRTSAGKGRKTDLVDYRDVAARTRQLVNRAAQDFFAHRGEGHADFRAFLERNPVTRDYARFRAVCDRRREGWTHWPARLRDGELRTGDFDPEDERYHLYAAWAADVQVSSLAAQARQGGAELYLDLPLGVHREGFDPWRLRHLFALDMSAGAPPDAFFSAGQDWGFPPMRPAALRADGYRYLIACLRHHLARAGALRLDHVMSLQRLFWVPPGLGPRHGVYVRYPLEELFAVLTLESVRHEALIVGEDLGTVSSAIRTAMKRHRVQRMFVVQFEVSPDRRDPLPPVPRSVSASLNTHDMPTFAAFWEGLDIADRLDLGLLDEKEVEQERAARDRLRRRLARQLGMRYPANLRRGGADGAGPDSAPPAEHVIGPLLDRLAASAARMVLVSVEDLWLETRPQNVPGTSVERPNWRRRARYTLEEMRNHAGLARELARIAALRDNRSRHG